MSAAFSAGNGERGTLNGWKEIASELNRGVRTVQRWERTLDLPVHRLGNARGAPVFVFRKELQLWWVKTASQDQCFHNSGSHVGQNGTDTLQPFSEPYSQQSSLEFGNTTFKVTAVTRQK
jgi:hypothetical protein